MFSDSRGARGVAKKVEGRRPSRVYERCRLLGCAIAGRSTELAQVDLRSAPPIATAVNPAGPNTDNIAGVGEPLDLLAKQLPV